MNGWIACLLLQTTLVTSGATTYKEAYHQSVETGRPLVVLVGADWCPACRTMKDTVLPELVRGGKLKDVEFAVVNKDVQPSLAGKLMVGTLIPQMIVYSPTSNGWKRIQVTGVQSPRQVEQLIEQAQNLKRPQIIPASVTQ